MDSYGVVTREDVLTEGEEFSGCAAFFLRDILFDVVLPKAVLEHGEGCLREAGAVHGLGIAEVGILKAIEGDGRQELVVARGAVLLAGLTD